MFFPESDAMLLLWDTTTSGDGVTVEAVPPADDLLVVRGCDAAGSGDCRFLFVELTGSSASAVDPPAEHFVMCLTTINSW